MHGQLRSQLYFDITEENLPIRAEQIRTRLRTYPLMIIVRIIVVLFLIGLMWEKVAQEVLLTWAACLLILHGIESWYVYRYKSQTRTVRECEVWRRRLLIFVLLVGGMWGAGGLLLFVPGDLAYQSMLICVVVGVAAGAVTTNPVFPPALYIFEVLLIVPLTLSNSMVWDAAHIMLALMLMVYLVYVLNAGKALADIFEISLRRTLEKEELVQRLRTENQRVESAQLRAEQANLSKSKFLAAASHDLRQPMHALTLFVEALKPHVAGVHGGRLMAQVSNSVEVLGDMFDALLDISRLDAGVVLPKYQHFPLRQVFDRIESEFFWTARDKELTLTVQRCEGRIYSDPLLVERILRNLIFNAIRYTEMGTIEVRCRAVESGLLVEVCDSGMGIAPQHLPHIFEEYYQIGNTQRDRNNGLGLGLAIVHRLALLLDAQVSVTSTLGVGSCFGLVIPQQDADVMMHVQRRVESKGSES